MIDGKAANDLATTSEQPRDTQATVALAADPFPAWYLRGLVVLVSAVLAFGGIGLLLAIVGHYHLALVLPLGALGTIIGVVIAWPRRTGARASRSHQVAAAVMCAVAVGFALWNGAHSGHHVVVGRDPGVYSDTAKWVATHGTLEVPAVQDWTGKGLPVTLGSGGTYAQGANDFEFQFDHLTPVLMAEADNIGGDGLMFRVTALLGSLGLLAVFAVGCRLVRRPWLVLAGVIGLGFSLPQLSVTRDSYSEPALQFLLWSGLALLLAAYERRRPGMALLGGLAIGGTLLTRIDGLVYLIPLPIVGALTYLAARTRSDRRSARRLIIATAAGVIPAALLGTIDAKYRSGNYYNDLHKQVHQLQSAVIASVVVGLVLGVVWPLLAPHVSGVRSWVDARRRGIGVALGVFAGLVLLAGWFIRPLVQHPRGPTNALIASLQKIAGLTSDPGRTYAEYSLRWMAWYLGPATVALAIAGAAILVARLVRRPSAPIGLVLPVAGVGSALYLWNPSNTADQIWVLRRFVPACLPLLVILACVCVEAIIVFALAHRAPVWPVRVVAVLVAAALVYFPFRTTEPVRNFVPSSVALPVIKDACRTIGPNAAVLFPASDAGAAEYVGAMRSWCNVPTATLTRPATPQALQAAAETFQAQGRKLWFVSSAAKLISAANPGGPAPRAVGPARELDRILEMTVNHPPDSYVPESFALYAAPVVP